jgi:hypothetical protein
MKKVKLLCVLGFLVFGISVLFFSSRFTPVVEGFSSGPPPGYTGAPGETTCADCHFGSSGTGMLSITAPQNYVPGQTYQIQVQHATLDQTRMRWGFELTALANFTAAGTFNNLGNLTQTVDFNNRFYIEHTSTGTFFGQHGGAQWTFEWVAPPEDIGPVTFYAAGNEANGDGTSGGDQIYTATALSQPAGSATPTNTPTFTPTSTPTFTPTNTPTATPTSTPPPAGGADFDYDGDGKTDISIFRPSNGDWFLQMSRDGLYGAEFGFGSDKITPADYDGDGKTDVAVYRPSDGIWYIFQTSTGTVDYRVFGIAEDLPTPADYDGDGRADISVFRPSTATWYRQNSSDGSFYARQFGETGDNPTIGDFDGDNHADLAIFRPSLGDWYQVWSSDDSVHGARFGFNTDVIVPADWDGDGRTDIAVYRPADGIWYLTHSSDGSFDYKVFGLSDDIPAPGDFDGDGTADISVFRPSSGIWFRQNSSDGSFVAFPFGTNGDKPTQTAYRY